MPGLSVCMRSWHWIMSWPKRSSKKSLKPCVKREIGLSMVDRHGYSRASRVLDVSRSVLYYTSHKDDSVIETALLKKAADYPTEGFWKASGRLRLEGHEWNHKRVFRIYQQPGLSLKRLPKRTKEPLKVPKSADHTWSIDFMERSTNQCFSVCADPIIVP